MHRCPWAKGKEYEQYHDTEWGVPVRDDRTLFEFLILEGAQAGLSWATILNKRDAYREAFEDFDPNLIARFTPARIEKLLQPPRDPTTITIVRNRLKVNAAVTNAKAYLLLRSPSNAAKNAHPLADFLWLFPDPTGNKRPIQNRWKPGQVPATTPISEAMSKALRKRGFTFVGPTIMYAFMQATGMVNDHLLTCPRHKELAA